MLMMRIINEKQKDAIVMHNTLDALEKDIIIHITNTFN